MTHRNTWKAFERVVAKFFNSPRNPLSGGNSKHTRSDVINDRVYPECKYRDKMAIFTLFADTAEKAKAENKIPVCCLKQKNTNGWLLVCRPEDVHQISSEAKDCKNVHWS